MYNVLGYALELSSSPGLNLECINITILLLNQISTLIPVVSDSLNLPQSLSWTFLIKSYLSFLRRCSRPHGRGIGRRRQLMAPGRRTGVRTGQGLLVSGRLLQLHQSPQFNVLQGKSWPEGRSKHSHVACSVYSLCIINASLESAINYRSTLVIFKHKV